METTPELMIDIRWGAVKCEEQKNNNPLLRCVTINEMCDKRPAKL